MSAASGLNIISYALVETVSLKLLQKNNHEKREYLKQAYYYTVFM